MNNQDKEEFEKWELDYFGQNDNCPIYMVHIKNTWKYACEYKQKEIDILKNHDIACYKEAIYCLESENKKLRDALENIETK